jgi:large subunit ribosomal protein L23
MNIYEVLKRPLVTEKTAAEKEKNNTIAFEIAKSANKIEVKAAVEKIFQVSVLDVKTINIAGKAKRLGKNIGKRSNWKKAYVTLKEGSKVDFFEV